MNSPVSLLSSVQRLVVPFAPGDSSPVQHHVAELQAVIADMNILRLYLSGTGNTAHLHTAQRAIDALTYVYNDLKDICAEYERLQQTC